MRRLRQHRLFVLIVILSITAVCIPLSTTTPLHISGHTFRLRLRLRLRLCSSLSRRYSSLRPQHPRLLTEQTRPTLGDGHGDALDVVRVDGAAVRVDDDDGLVGGESRGDGGGGEGGEERED
jgi:hypothetical protein